MGFKGTLVVTVENAVDLEAADLNGKSDPYVLVRVKSITDNKLDSSYKEIARGWKQKTSIKKKELNPIWNEIMTFSSLFVLDNTDEGIKLVFKVVDWDLLSKDDKIGNAEIILKPSELEHKKKYSASLKLHDCKSGTLNISYSVSSSDKEVVEKEFEYHSPFTPSTCQLRIPGKFSVLSTASVAESRCAIFADLKNQSMIFITMTKQAESVDFSKLEKKVSKKLFREMRKKYLNVAFVFSTFDTIKHCKNAEITNIFVMEFNFESVSGAKMVGNLRIVLHSNNHIVTYLYLEPEAVRTLGRYELAIISENSNFFDP